MGARPCVIVLATGQGTPPVIGAGGAFRRGGLAALQQPLGKGSVLAMSVRQAIASHWPVTVVTTDMLAATVGRWIATRDIVVVGAADLQRGRGRALAMAVMAQGDADGWIVLPAERPLVRPATLRAVGDALAEHPVAYAQHRGRPGEPTGFAAELYSELMALDGDDAPRRLAARYPAAGVEVDDPGVLVDAASGDGLAQARAAVADAA